MHEEADGTPTGIPWVTSPSSPSQGRWSQLGPMCVQGPTNASRSWSSPDALPACPPNSLLQGAEGTQRPGEMGEHG